MRGIHRKERENRKNKQKSKQKKRKTHLTHTGLLMEGVSFYPMSYQPRENEKVVFQFSRTAEEKSDWVFLSMKDESGARSYDTPETKIVALPCLDSKK